MLGRSVLLLPGIVGRQGCTDQDGQLQYSVRYQQKKVINTIKQEYLAYLFLHNSNGKMHSQLKKDVANRDSKGNTNVYPTDIYKALTLMSKYKPLI